MNTGLVIISLCACKCYSLRCLPQKGRTKEHVIVQPNPTLPHHPHPPSPSTASTFTFSLFFALLLSLRMLHLYHQPPYTTRPLVLLFLLPPSPCSSSTTFASPSSPSPLSLRLSLSFYARVLITGSRTG